MLEKNFNELDNDFVTCWSYYIINQELRNKFYALKVLASMGQINAMQCLPLLTDCGDLSYIEPENYAGSDMYNLDLLNLNRYLRKFNNQVNPTYDNIIYTQEKKTLESHRLYYQLTDNPLILERYYEVKGKTGLIIRLSTRKLRKTLELLYSKDPENAMYAYAYAKNCFFFGNEHEKEIGKNILTHLSKRELSKTVQDILDKQEKERRERKEKENKSFIDRFIASLSDKEKFIADGTVE